MDGKILMSNLKEANLEWENAKRTLAEAKKRLLTAENNVINLKINRDNTVEALRLHEATTQQFDLVDHERHAEIDDFRNRFPELCEMADARDKAK
jgi:hypothetical protein